MRIHLLAFGIAAFIAATSLSASIRARSRDERLTGQSARP